MAGKSGLLLTVKNLGSQTCMLYRWDPIELAIDQHDPKSIGAAATLDPKPTEDDDVILEPGATASTSVEITNADNLPNCQPQQAWVIDVEAGRGNAFVVSPVTNVRGCTNRDVSVMKAKPFKHD